MTVGETFELCQAGYPERKLAYNSRTRLVFSKPIWNISGITITFRNLDFSTFHVAKGMQNHEAVEGVIYEASCHNEADLENCHAKFYLRPRMNSHRGPNIPHHLLMVRAADLRAWRFKSDNRTTIEDFIHALMEAQYVH